jgi:hypothetical protein
MMAGNFFLISRAGYLVCRVPCTCKCGTPLKASLDWVWWFTPVIPYLGRGSQKLTRVRGQPGLHSETVPNKQTSPRISRWCPSEAGQYWTTQVQAAQEAEEVGKGWVTLNSSTLAQIHYKFYFALFIYSHN